MDLDGAKEKRKKRNKIRPVKKRESSVSDNIDVTPLVNVALILLIIFMVITPEMERGKSVPMPETEFHAAPEDANQPIVVIDSDGTLYVDRDEVDSPEEMQEGVQEEWDRDDVENTGTVYLKVVPDIDYGTVYPVIDALHEIGVRNVELGTEEYREI